jgi:putative DNA primase/helicase
MSKNKSTKSGSTSPPQTGVGLIPKLPTINTGIGDIAELAELAWKALIKANDPPIVLSHANALVRIEHRDAGASLIRELDHDRLRFRLARCANWTRPGLHGPTPTAPPSAVVRDLLARPDPPLPVLRYLVFGPYVTATGVLHVSPGYSAESQLFYQPRGKLDLAIPSTPSPQEILEARARLQDVIGDFGFVNQASLAHAVALAIVPFVQELIDGPTPLHVIDKPTPGSGGGLLMDALLWPALGRPAPKMTAPRDESEWRRTVVTMLLCGSQVIGLDNIRERLESPALASALTEATVVDRIVGSSKAAEIDARRIWVAVGNNLEFSGEMARRAIPIRIDPCVENPELRTGFKYVRLRRHLAKHRTELVQAALVIVQAWIAQGRPTGKRTLGSFESWSDVMGGILQVAGLPGFLDDLLDTQPSDPLETAWKGFIALWWEKHHQSEVGVTVLLGLLADHADLLAELDLAAPNVDPKNRLGKRLSERRNRVFGGYQLRRAAPIHGANRWRLAPAQQL